MTQSDDRAMDVLRVAAYLVPLFMAAAMLCVGIFYYAYMWGVLLLITGFFGLFAVGLGKWQESPILGTYSFLMVICLGLIVIGLSITDNPWSYVLISGGVTIFLVAGVVASLSLQLNRLLGDGFGNSDAQLMQSQRILELMGKIYEASIISDASKRTLFKDNELALLRRKIDDFIAKGQYDAGLALCDSIEKNFDSSDEADSFRHHILRNRQDHHEAEIHGTLEQFGRLLASRDWARAHQEAARIRRLYPDAPVLKELDLRIHAARDEHKQELQARFAEATSHENLPDAMRLLRELDRYLTREEAAKLAADAQAVVEKHRQNLTTRFKMAVSDRRWGEAVQIGDLIVDEFPNTKVAEEVNSMIEVLRTRAIEEPTPLSKTQE